MKYYIKSIEDIAKLLEDYDYFHDSVIKTIIIKFLDNTDLLGNIEVDMKLSCHNFQQEKREDRQLISVHFKGVRDIYLDFRQKDPIEWDIMAVSIEKYNELTEDLYFTFKVLYPKFVATNGSWQKTEKEHELFLFKEAEFEEDQE